MVAASITLCLDLLHRTEDEPEFVKHRQLVDKAISIMGCYCGSALASRGIRLLSSLLAEATNKHQSSKPRTGFGKRKSSHLNDPGSPPCPEKRHTVDALLAVKEPSSGTAASHSTTSYFFSESGGYHVDNVADTEDYGARDVQFRPANDDYFNFPNANGIFGTANDDDLVVDASWTEFFSEYFPTQGGFESAFLADDLFT